MNPNSLIFDTIKKMADSIVMAFGKNCEIVVHDFSCLDKSIIHVAGDVTGRKSGAPVTDFVLKRIREHGNDVTNCYHYKTMTQNGRVLKSSTIFVRNASGQVIGCYCINIDVTDLMNTVHMINDMIRTEDLPDCGQQETFASSVSETLGALIDKATEVMGKQPALLTREERLVFIDTLERMGGFVIKGSVDQIALVMGLSKYTVYRYLQTVRS
jgi:predicted transcriptional regulator YheO